MKQIQVVALALTSLLAAASLAAEAQRLDSPAANSAPLTARQSISTQPIWFTDFPKAQAKAKAEGKSVLLFFQGPTGARLASRCSVRCLTRPNLPNMPDGRWFSWTWTFLKNKSQSDEVKRANLALKTRFNLSEELGGGYPTLVLLNDRGGTLFQETGYAGGGPAEVLPKCSGTRKQTHYPLTPPTRT